MREAYEAGYVRAIGVSNFNEGFYSRFLGECGIVPAVDQVEAHLSFQQDRLRVLLAEYGTAMQAWSPFAASKNNFFQNPVLRAAAERLGRTPAQIALRFLVQRGIAVVPKTARRERMAENAAIFDFSLSGGDMAELRALDEGRTLFGWY